jgi:hypothetical protein
MGLQKVPRTTHAPVLTVHLKARRGQAGEEFISHLWKAIVTTRGPLRLSWPDIQAWARADYERAHISDTTGTIVGLESARRRPRG